MIEDALFSRLSGFAGLTSLVGTRIYPVQLPQDVTLPAVVYTRISSEREVAMGKDPGIARPRFDVSAWATTFDSSRAIAEQIRLALERFRGTEAGIVIQDIFVEAENDVFDSTSITYHAAIDFEVIHEEAT